MGYKTVTVTVDADVWIDDVINEIDDQELIDELTGRGYTVTKNDSPQVFDTYDWKFLLELIDRQKYNWELRRVRDKVLEAISTK
jgi:hypothetical protein